MSGSNHPGAISAQSDWDNHKLLVTATPQKPYKLNDKRDPSKVINALRKPRNTYEPTHETNIKPVDW